MKVILMNKNTEILSAELENNNTFSKIYEYYNINYAPLQIYNAYKDNSKSNLKELNHWFQGRGIPSWRQNLEKLLEKLNINSSQELLNKAYALSLSDQYWIKEINQNLIWDNINFFNNDFEYEDYLEAAINYDAKNTNKISLYSPNNTTDGMVKKGWTIDSNKKRTLIKGTYTLGRLDPISEYLASLIGKELGINYCNYELDIKNNQLICKCENFLNDDEEIISACDIMELEKKDNNTSDYEHYINILEKNGIKNARKELANMYIIDFLLMNTDRHMKNYGIIRNVKTLKWEKTTPIFDTGNSLQSSKPTNEINFYNDTYKFFNSRTMTFNDLLKYIDIKNYDINKLKKITSILNNTLIKYKNIIDLSEERYKKTIDGFNLRIKLLEEYFQKKYQ